jgi:rhodanese-related sulfurtransferase
MTAEDAHGFFEQGGAIFIDARAPEAFALGRIEGAVNVPPAGATEDVSWLVGADARVICYASEDTQRQAGVVADQLLDLGCDKVFVLHGGLEAWIELGLPMDETTG